MVGIIQNCTVQNQPYENLAYTAIRFFCVLSAYCTIKEKIIEEGGMEAASGLYEVPIVFKKHIRLTALWALRNLSDKGIDFQKNEIYIFIVSNYPMANRLNSSTFSRFEVFRPSRSRPTESDGNPAVHCHLLSHGPWSNQSMDHIISVSSD